jgi:hypothetical protein
MPIAPITVHSYDGTKQKIDEDNPIAVAQVFGGLGSKDWQIRMYRDLVVNDNDKTITVPANHQWQILSIYVVYASSADAGTRQLQIDFRDQTGVTLFEQRPNATQAVDETRRYSIGPSMANLTSFYDTDHLQTPLPPTIFLDAAWSIRFFDNNNITANDDLDIFVLYADREI